MTLRQGGRYLALAGTALALMLPTAAAAATKPGAPAPDKGGSAANFRQLKQQVDRQAKKIKALERSMAWYDVCVTQYIDVGEAMDLVVGWVAPLDTTWVPLDNLGLYALAVDPGCVEADTAGTMSFRRVMPTSSMLERITR